MIADESKYDTPTKVTDMFIKNNNLLDITTSNRSIQSKRSRRVSKCNIEPE